MDSSSQNLTTLGLAVGAGLCAAGYLFETIRRAGLFQVLLFDWKALPTGRTLMFKPFQGRYRDISKSWKEVMVFTEGHPGCPNEVWGLYFDDPKRVEESKCRYSLGVVMNGNATKELESILTQNGFIKVDDVPANTNFLHTSFPFTGMLSIIFLVMRVYPRFEVECKKQNVKEDADGMMVEVTRTKEGVSEIFHVNTKCEPLLKARQ
jgi:hypothetical protein